MTPRWCTKSKISVASPPARLRIACLPPGCMEMYWVTSSTEPPMITQQSVSSLCSATSSWLIVNLMQLGGLGGARPDVLCPIGSAPWTSLGPWKASPWAATADRHTTKPLEEATLFSVLARTRKKREHSYTKPLLEIKIILKFLKPSAFKTQLCLKVTVIGPRSKPHNVTQATHWQARHDWLSVK